MPARFRPRQSAKDRQIFNIFVQIGRLRSLEATRQLSKARVLNNVPERFPPDFSLTDPSMPVDPGTKIRFGVVEMKRQDLGEADRRIEFLDGGIPPLGGSNIVASRKKMGRVEANPQPLGLLHPVIDGREMFQLMAEAGALARRILQSDPDRGHFRGLKHLVQAGYNLSQAGLLAFSQMRPGM